MKIIEASTGQIKATIPIKYGNNPVSIIVINGEEKYEMGRILYHDKMSIELDIKGLNKKKGILTTDKDIIEIEGNVSSYMTLNNISVNNESIYTSVFGRATSNGKPIKTPYKTTVHLNKGMNYIVVEARNMLGQMEQYKVEVEYKYLKSHLQLYIKYKKTFIENFQRLNRIFKKLLVFVYNMFVKVNKV